jgi:tetratricopeptide (TPR) repeat protein
MNKIEKNSSKNIYQNSDKVLFSFCLLGMICFNGIVASVQADDDFFPIFDVNSEMINKKEKTSVSFPLPNLSQSALSAQNSISPASTSLSINKQINQPHQNTQRFVSNDLSNASADQFSQNNNSINNFSNSTSQFNPNEYWKPAHDSSNVNTSSAVNQQSQGFAKQNFQSINNSSLQSSPSQAIQQQAIQIQPIQGINQAEIKRAEANDMPLLMEAVKTSPQNAEEFFKRGVAKYRLKDFTGSIEDLNQVIDKNSEFVGEAYLYRGRCKKALKDSQGAVADLKQSLQLNPDSANFYLQSGISREKGKDFTGAVSEYSKALEYKKDFVEAYINRGYAKAQTGNLGAALQDLNKAIELDEESSDAYRKRGYIKYQMRNYKGSMDDHEKAKNLYQQKGDMQSYQSVVQSINLLREIMVRN